MCHEEKGPLFFKWSLHTGPPPLQKKKKKFEVKTLIHKKSHWSGTTCVSRHFDFLHVSTNRRSLKIITIDVFYFYNKVYTINYLKTKLKYRNK